MISYGVGCFDVWEFRVYFCNTRKQYIVARLVWYFKGFADWFFTKINKKIKKYKKLKINK